MVGARVRVATRTREIRARQVVLATGAVPQALIAADLCERRTPSAVALRGYVHNPAMVDRITELEVVWHKRLSKGYGWIFPCRDGVFNVGVGLIHSHAKQLDGRQTMQDVNLREMFAAFCEVYAPARELMRGGTMVGELKGAPLRCSLDGAASDAAGHHGHRRGRGQHLRVQRRGHRQGDGDRHAGCACADRCSTAPASPQRPTTRPSMPPTPPYEAAIAALKPRFDLYERANRVNEHPWLADLLIWRANRVRASCGAWKACSRRPKTRAT